MNQNSAMRQKDIRPAPAEIEYKSFRFLITDRPSDQNINFYIQVSRSANRPDKIPIPSDDRANYAPDRKRRATEPDSPNKPRVYASQLPLIN